MVDLPVGFFQNDAPVQAHRLKGSGQDCELLSRQRSQQHVAARIVRQNVPRRCGIHGFRV
jgi:hypothetical protein